MGPAAYFFDLFSRFRFSCRLISPCTSSMSFRFSISRGGIFAFFSMPQLFRFRCFISFSSIFFFRFSLSFQLHVSFDYRLGSRVTFSDWLITSRVVAAPIAADYRLDFADWFRLIFSLHYLIVVRAVGHFFLRQAGRCSPDYASSLLLVAFFWFAVGRAFFMPASMGLMFRFRLIISIISLITFQISIWCWYFFR